MIKQDDILTYTAEAYGNAETVGKVNGVTVFVPEMIVGEKALVKVTYAKGNVAYATVQKLLTVSPKRRSAKCNNFGKCGGCSLMFMEYDEQLRFKQNKVRQNLDKIGGLNVEVAECGKSPAEFFYRNKLSLPVRGKASCAQIGMYKRGTHEVVNADSCLLGGKWCDNLVRLFRSFLDENKIPPYNEKNFGGAVRHLVARFVDGQLLVTVVTNGEQSLPWKKLYESLEKVFPKVGLFVNINTQKNNVILGKTTKHLYGLPCVEAEHLGVKFQLAPDSFFQVNNAVKDEIYKQVKSLLDISQTEVLVEGFSGIGILTTVLASEKYQTIAVELEECAVKDAEKAAQINNAPNVTNICGDVNEWLPKITQQHKGKNLTLVVDPPRKGLGERICQTIKKAAFDNIVYISCDSATLARDLSCLKTHYEVDFVQPWDMFPNTAEVETVVHLKRI